MNKCIERLYNGIIKENPTFVLMLGMCPTLAVTTIGHQRPWYGSVHDGGIGFRKHHYRRTAKDHPGRRAYAG